MNRLHEQRASLAKHQTRRVTRALRSLGTATALTLLVGSGCSSSDGDGGDGEQSAGTGASAGSSAAAGSAGSNSPSFSFTDPKPGATEPNSAIPPAEGWKLDPATSVTVKDGDWPSDCEQFYSFRAHGEAKVNDTTPYNVPQGSEYYESFFFTAPWGEQEVQALQFRAVIQNPRIVHHWIVYGVTNSNLANGSMQGGPQQFLPTTLSGEAFINGWAPGQDPVQLPEDVGLYIPSGKKATFRLEIHYNNLAGKDVGTDASGVDFCVTSKKRTNEAATHWLGTPNFSVPAHSTKDVSSTCVPKITEGPVHVLSISPHMHQTGVHAKALLKRADGTEESLLDDPFEFANQKAIAMPRDGSAEDLLINAGDTITTTCTFDNTTNSAISFGENTDDEMCFFYTTAWPKGQLVNNTFTLIPGAERSVNCLQ